MVTLKRSPLWYPEISLTEFLKKKAKEMHNKYAIVYPVKLTYVDFWACVDKLASALANVGVKIGDRVCLFEWNSPEFEIAFNAIVQNGAIVVPLNPMSKEMEIEYVVNDSSAKIIVVRDELFSRVRNVLPNIPSVKKIIVIGKRIPNTLSFDHFMEKYSSKPLTVNINPREDLCVLPYTSGTTGLPKGVMLTHYNITSNILQASTAFQVHENDIPLNVTPFYHIFGMLVGMLMSLYIGATQVIIKEFHRKDFCELINTYRVTYAFLVPPMFIALISYSDLLKYDWSSLRFVANGAAPISPEVAKKFQELTGVTVYHQWGLTEASPVVAANPWYKIKVESQGIPLSDTEHKVIDPETCKELPIGEIGELIIKGPQVMKGYWNRPNDTEEAFITINGEKWLRTGDIAKIDEEGYEYLIDRRKEMIKHKGFSVSPTELEKLILTHPCVEDCAVIGKPNSYAGEIPVAFIVTKPRVKVTSEEIIDFVKNRIAEYKCVKEVEFVDTIPRTHSGKILRRVLKEIVSASP